MKNLITICGRGGSKGVKNKNIREINGKPLIGYSIEKAIEFSEIFNADIAISTDSDEILSVANSLGVKSDYVRPAKLATDSAGKLDVIQDLIIHEERKSNERYEYILDLDITSPLRTINDLKEAFEMLKSKENALNIFSVSPANRNPYFNMIEEVEDGHCKLVKEGSFLTRQSAPKVFDLNASFYFYKRSFFDQKEMKVISPTSLFYEIKHTCFDVDHEIDFDILDYLICNNKLDFNL